MTAPLLTVSNLSKRYCGHFARSLRYAVADSVREIAGRPARSGALRPGEFWALQDVSFSLAAGESLAVVGANGAGKSTLLKILHGLLKPEAGEVRLACSLGALIELGTGLNPLLTGRENVRLAAAMNDLDAAGARRLLDEVVDFAGLGEAMEAPFQTYSSGMKARLAFSLVALMRPGVLLVDEVLAVGDLAFQRKCVGLMQAYLREGGSLVFVSHNGHQVQSVCERAILLEGGRIAFAGSAVETLHHMYGAGAAPETLRREESGPVVIEDLFARGDAGADPHTGEAVELVLRYRAQAPLEAIWAVTIWSPDGWVCIAMVANEIPRRLAAGRGELVCRIPRLPLVGGRYRLTAGLVDPATLHPLALLGGDDGGATLEVASHPSLLTNLARQRGQILELEAHWL
ncbi:MAG TPA: ABC transporter ATP-binding protein [Allosphingosinicella sp.]|jgi:lipopolysaccharide transport system ATP-binding protein